MMKNKSVETDVSANKPVVLCGSMESTLEKLCRENGVNLSCIKQVMTDVYSTCVCSIEAIKELFEVIQRSIVESAAPALQAMTESLKPFTTESLFFMVPPHIRHLAYNHPKHHVRNKNWNRMWKIRERYMRCHKQ